jgi:hypothetical protein
MTPTKNALRNPDGVVAFYPSWQTINGTFAVDVGKSIAHLLVNQPLGSIYFRRGTAGAYQRFPCESHHGGNY